MPHQQIMTNLRTILERLPLPGKICGLFAATILLFFSNLYATTYSLSLHFLLMAIVVLIFATSAYFIIEKSAFKNMLKLWFIGTIVYSLFAIPRIYLAGSLSPYYDLNILTDRWLYSFLLPLILLGTLSVGLIFVRITSPVEFLKWGNVGTGITLLFRSLQHAAQIFSETKIALMMQDQWPEEKHGLFSFRETWQIIKYSPFLIRTAIRNIILYWFPWGWLCFNKLQKNLNKRGISNHAIVPLQGKIL